MSTVCPQTGSFSTGFCKNERSSHTFSPEETVSAAFINPVSKSVIILTGNSWLFVILEYFQRIWPKIWRSTIKAKTNGITLISVEPMNSQQLEPMNSQQLSIRTRDRFKSATHEIIVTLSKTFNDLVYCKNCNAPSVFKFA